MVESLYPFYERKQFETISSYIDYHFSYHKEAIFCEYAEGDEVIKVSYGKTFEAIKKLSVYFDGTQQKVGLLGQMSYEWLVSYLSVLFSGNIAVPLDNNLSNEEIKRRVIHSDLDLLLTSHPYIESSDFQDASLVRTLFFHKGEVSVNSIMNDEAYPTAYIFPKMTGEDLTEIGYTSGTSGFAKGVVITQNNLISSVMFGTMMLDLKPDDIVFSVLPNNHLYELTAGILTPIYFGVPIAINGHIKNIGKNLQKYQPTTIVLVPAILQNIQKMIISKLTKRSQKVLFNLLLGFSKKAIWLSDSTKQKLFKEVHQAFGGNLRQVICGGAPLDEELVYFFDALGINTIEGYGITECCPIISSNTNRHKVIGSVGKVNPFCQLKIESDGEILVSGDIVMREYLKDQEKTKLAFEGKWFKTGDLGEIDADGFLYVKGRKKNIIILANGENIVPEELELKISRITLIEEVVVKEVDGKIAAEIYTEEEINHPMIEQSIIDMNQKMQMNQRIQIIIFRSIPFKKNTSHKIIR